MSLGPDHERWEDSAGTYVLGALPEFEEAAYEAHLAACTVCRAEVEDLRMAAEALPLSPPPSLPPAGLKLRIMAEVEREAALLSSASGRTDAGAAGATAAAAPARGRGLGRWLGRRGAYPSGGWRVPAGAVAALACVALAAGIGLGGLLFGGEDGRSIPFQSTVRQASAELELRDGGAILVAQGLPAAPAGQVYMVWIQRPGQAPEPTSALFTPRRDGSATASVTGDLEGVETVLVNTEPVGGSTTPTSQPFLTAALS
jgi:anti-sigma factor RsiW